MERGIRNDARVVVVTLEVMRLKLLLRDYLYLEECYYVPSIVNNIISIYY